MRIMLCEDSQADREKLMDFCARHQNETSCDIEIDSCDNVAALPGKPDADLLFLDIYMDDEPKGVATARALRERDWRGVIVFTTTSREHYSEGFEVGAVHYLVKPFTYEAFCVAMDRAFQVLGHPERMYTVPIMGGQIILPESRIYYAEVHNHELLLHLDTETVRVLLPLKELEALLSVGPFLRTFRSHIVNMDQIARVEADHILLHNGERLPLALRNRQALRSKYVNYRFGDVRGH